MSENTNERDILAQADELDKAILDVANGRIKPNRLPLEPMVKLIKFARESIAHKKNETVAEALEGTISLMESMIVIKPESLDKNIKLQYLIKEIRALIKEQLG